MKCFFASNVLGVSMELNRARQVLNNSMEKTNNANEAYDLWKAAREKYIEGVSYDETYVPNRIISKAMCIKYICDLVGPGCLNTIELFFPTYFSLNLNKLLFLIGVYNYFGNTTHWEMRKIREMERNERNWCRHDTKWQRVDVIDVGRKAVHNHFYVVHQQQRRNKINSQHLYWANKHDESSRNEMEARAAVYALENPAPDIMNQPVPVNNNQQQIDEVWGKIASAPNADDPPE